MSDILRGFDKKNEFPKVTIDRMKIGGKELAEELANNILNGNFDLGIEKIAKDIVKRQDNAMAMEFTKCIVELLRMNGVVPKLTEYTSNFETDNTFETRYGVSIDELDFSEHDKVFEDKIAELEKQIERVMREKQLAYDRSEQLMKTADILNSANKELKQRIAELESKETESFDEVPDDITIDGYKCKIIKTESGLYISRDEIYSIIDKEKEPLKQKYKELEDRHQSDCIEINRLNTTIDVLIHKVEYLRQFAGLE